jgi:hypothetical protein
MKTILLNPLDKNHNIYLIASEIISNIPLESIKRRLYSELEAQSYTYYINSTIKLTVSTQLFSTNLSEVDYLATFLENEYFNNFISVYTNEIIKQLV